MVGRVRAPAPTWPVHAPCKSGEKNSASVFNRQAGVDHSSHLLHQTFAAAEFGRLDGLVEDDGYRAPLDGEVPAIVTGTTATPHSSAK